MEGFYHSVKLCEKKEEGAKAKFKVRISMSMYGWLDEVKILIIGDNAQGIHIQNKIMNMPISRKKYFFPQGQSIGIGSHLCLNGRNIMKQVFQSYQSILYHLTGQKVQQCTI